MHWERVLRGEDMKGIVAIDGSFDELKVLARSRIDRYGLQIHEYWITWGGFLRESLSEYCRG